jgi:hypothetical protein
MPIRFCWYALPSVSAGICHIYSAEEDGVVSGWASCPGGAEELTVQFENGARPASMPLAGTRIMMPGNLTLALAVAGPGQMAGRPGTGSLEQLRQIQAYQNWALDQVSRCNLRPPSESSSVALHACAGCAHHTAMKQGGAAITRPDSAYETFGILPGFSATCRRAQVPACGERRCLH